MTLTRVGAEGVKMRWVWRLSHGVGSRSALYIQKEKKTKNKKKKQQQLGFYPKSVWEPPGSLKLGCDMIPLIVLKEHQLLSGGEWMGTEAKVEAFYSFSWRLVERWLWLNLGGGDIAFLSVFMLVSFHVLPSHRCVFGEVSGPSLTTDAS